MRRLPSDASKRAKGMADTGERRSLHHCIAASNACRCFRKLQTGRFFWSQYVVLQRGNDSVAWKLKQDQGKCSACASANACSSASSCASLCARASAGKGGAAGRERAEKDGCSSSSRGSRVLVAAAAALLGEFFWTTLEQHWCSEPLSGVKQKKGRRPQRAVEPVLRLA